MPRVIQFQEVQNLQKDVLRSNLAGGSDYVARRVAIENIGGILENTISEDWIASLKLHHVRWEIVYVNELLQWGLMPDSFAGHIRQRQRWQEGFFSVADYSYETLSKNPSWGFKLRLRVLFLETLAVLIVGVSNLCFLAVPLILLLGRVLVLQQSLGQLRFLLRFAVVDMVA